MHYYKLRSLYRHRRRHIRFPFVWFGYALFCVVQCTKYKNWNIVVIVCCYSFFSPPCWLTRLTVLFAFQQTTHLYFVGVHCVYTIQIAEMNVAVRTFFFTFSIERIIFDFMLARCQCTYAWLRICNQQKMNGKQEKERRYRHNSHSHEFIPPKSTYYQQWINRQEDALFLSFYLSLFALSQRLISDVDCTLCTQFKRTLLHTQRTF